MKVYILEDDNLFSGAFSTFEKAKQRVIDNIEKYIKNIEKSQILLTQEQIKSIVTENREQIEFIKNIHSRENFNEYCGDAIWIYESEVDAEQ